MAETALIYNNQALGDMLLGTYLAQVIKREHPDWHITFAIQNNAMLTMSTNDPDNGVSEMVEILAIQPGIDSFGLIHPQNGQLQIIKGESQKQFDHIYHQSEWWSDLGAAASMQVPYLLEQGLSIEKDKIDTNTVFTVGEERVPFDKITVATAGPLDWNNKIKNDNTRKKILNNLKKYGLQYDYSFKIIELGADTVNLRYLESLKILNKCHIYIGPEGSMGHMAAGLGLDTITISSVYPEEWLAPEHYHSSGWHRAISTRKEFHCGDYKCVHEKPYRPGPPGWGNPRSDWSTWPSRCPYITNGRSCIWNTSVEDVSKTFKEWLDFRYKERWNPF